MKIIGIVFIMVSSISAGLRIGSVLKYRCKHLRHWLDALLLLKNELMFSAMPLPKLCSALSNSVQGIVSEIFADISQQMEENRWMSFKTAMERTLKKYPDDPSEEVLLELAGTMGKYDVDAQIGGIDIAITRIQQLLNTMECERSIKSKTYKTLSICAGLATVILLL